MMIRVETKVRISILVMKPNIDSLHYVNTRRRETSIELHVHCLFALCASARAAINQATYWMRSRVALKEETTANLHFTLAIKKLIADEREASLSN